jgi:rubrerythrin
VNETEIKGILTKFLQKVDQTTMSDDDDLQAIRTAIDFESKGTDFYKKLRDAVTDKKEKEFFDLLAKIEYDHLKFLDSGFHRNDRKRSYPRIYFHESFDNTASTEYA